MTTLRDATLNLERGVNDALGDEITYTPVAGQPVTFNAWVEFGTDRVVGNVSSANTAAIVIEVPFATVAIPQKSDRITITIRPGQLYAPAGWEQADTGEAWRIILKKVLPDE